VAYHCHLFVNKLCFCHVKKLQLGLLKAGVVLSYARNIQRNLSIVSFFLKVQSLESMAISRSHSFRQFSLIFS